MEAELALDQALGLKARPGYAFGLGSDRWSASQFEGTVEGWSGQAVSWVSRSLLQRATAAATATATATATASADDAAVVVGTGGTVLAALDMNFYVTPLIDVPHARLTAMSTADRHLLCVDYLPRVELATHMDYFDRYFHAVEETMLTEFTVAAVACGVAPLAVPDTVLARMLTSPFALRVQVFHLLIRLGHCTALCFHRVTSRRIMSHHITPHHTTSHHTTPHHTTPHHTTPHHTTPHHTTPHHIDEQVDAQAPGGLEALQRLGLGHIQRWHRWLGQAAEVPVDQRQALYDRDERLQRLHFEDQKFRFARVMGASFAPKAAELSAAVMGPALGAQPYYYLGSDEFHEK